MPNYEVPNTMGVVQLGRLAIIITTELIISEVDRDNQKQWKLGERLYTGKATKNQLEMELAALDRINHDLINEEYVFGCTVWARRQLCYAQLALLEGKYKDWARLIGSALGDAMDGHKMRVSDATEFDAMIKHAMKEE